MGSSVRPERPNPFADLAAQERGNQAKPATANPFSDLADEEHRTSVPIGATLDSTPRLTPVGADGRPAVVMAEPPGALARTGAAIGQQVDAFKAHPLDAALAMGKTLITAPAESFYKAVLAPSTEQAARTARGDVSPAAEGFAGKMGIALRTPDAQQRALLETPSVTEGERGRAALQTGVNIASGRLGEGASYLAGKVFPKALAGLMGAGTAGAAIGAAYDPHDPLVGAGVGATLGGGLHVAVPLAASAAALPLRALDHATDVSGGMMEAGAQGAKQAAAQEAPVLLRSRAPNPDPLASENVAARRADRIAAGQEPPASKLPDGKVLDFAPAQAKRLTKAMAARQASAILPATDYLGGGRAVDKMAPTIQTPEQANAQPAIGLVGPDGTPLADLPARELPKPATRFDAAGRPTNEPAPKVKGAKATGPRFTKTLPDAAPATPAEAPAAAPTEATAAAQTDLAITHAPLKAKVLELQQQLDRVGQERDLARRAAETDALTGLANRGAYDHALPSAEQDPHTSVVRFDLNGFKAVNDAVSHQAGDDVLRSMRGVMEQAAKDTGIPARAFRVGGDEFAALVPKAQADAFRARVEELYGVQEHAPGVKSSVSGGIGATDAAADAEAIARKQAHKAAQGIAGRAAPDEMPTAKPDVATVQRMVTEGQLDPKDVPAILRGEKPFTPLAPKFDTKVNTRLFDAPDGTVVGTLGDVLKGEKVRALYKDILDTPIRKQATTPPEIGTLPEGAEWKGGVGRKYGEETIFMAPHASHEEFLDTLLHEAAHIERRARGRIDPRQTFDAGTDLAAYEASTPEQSAEKMAAHARSLREEPAAPAAHEPPVEEIDVDAREAERVKAEKKAARDAAKAEREASDAPQSKKPSDYRVMTPEQLLDEMHGEYTRIEAEGNKMRGPWSRFDDDISSQVTGGRFSDARAVQQAAFAKRRLTAIEGELAKRGVTPDEIAEGMQARRERDLIHTGDAEGGDTSFDFGEPEAKAIEAAPASPAAKEAATTHPREYLNYFRKNLDQTTEARVRQLVEEGRASGAIDKGTKTFAEQQAEADAFAKKLVSDPLLLDRQKLGKLSGAEVQGVWQVVQQNGRLMEAASRVLNDPAATPDAISEAQHVYDAATSSTNEALATVVRESARTARDLGFYRQFARQTLDPEVWLVQAKKLLGDRPLTEDMMMEVRRLANAAKQTCGGG